MAPRYRRYIPKRENGTCGYVGGEPVVLCKVKIQWGPETRWEAVISAVSWLREEGDNLVYERLGIGLRFGRKFASIHSYLWSSSLLKYYAWFHFLLIYFAFHNFSSILSPFVSLFLRSVLLSEYTLYILGPWVNYYTIGHLQQSLHWDPEPHHPSIKFCLFLFNFRLLLV